MRKLLLITFLLLQVNYGFGWSIQILSSNTGTSSVCAGTSVTLRFLNSNGNPSGAYWYTSASGSCSNYLGDYSQTYTFTANSTITVYACASQGGSAVASQTITICGINNWIPGPAKGPSQLCFNPPNTSYYISPQSGTVQWQLEPLAAGALIENGANVSIDWNDSFTGVAQLRYRYTITCCNWTNWSNPKEITVSEYLNHEVTKYDTICAFADYLFPDESEVVGILTDTIQVSELSSTFDCDSIVTTHLKVLKHPVIIHEGATTFCSMDSVFLKSNYQDANQWLFNGSVIPGATDSIFYPQQSGFYSLQIYENLYCNETIPISITVFDSPVANINLDGSNEICGGDSVILTSTGANQYLWSNGSTEQSIVVTQQGSYDVLVTGSNGCQTQSNSISVYVNNSPPTPSISVNSNVFLSSSQSGNQWLSNGSPIQGATGQFYTVSENGCYSLEVTDANGCTSSSAEVVYPFPTVTSDGPTTICSGETVTLSASTGSTYIWNSGQTTQSITVNQSGTFSVTVTDNGCSATSGVTTMTVNPTPTATITEQGSTTFCEGGSVVLQASGGGAYQWSTGAQTSNINVSQGGSYSVIVTDNGCSATSESVSVTINPLPTVSLASIAPLCENSSAVALSGGSPAGGTYTVNGASNTELNPAEIGSGSHTVAYTFTDDNGCINAATVNATVNVVPIVSFSGLSTNYTLNDSPTPLSGVPLGGAFTGAGVFDGLFDPAAAGLGVHCISYTYVDANDCDGEMELCTTVDINVTVDGGNHPDADVKVYPNPSNGLFTVVVDGIDGIVQFSVMDVRGRKVASQTLTARGRTTHSIDLSGLASGVYTLRIQSAKGVSGMKLVKE